MAEIEILSKFCTSPCATNARIDECRARQQPHLQPAHEMAFTAPAPVGTRAFSGARATCTTARPVAMRRRAAVVMVSATSIAKKSEKIEAVKARLAESDMIFAVDLPGLTVAQVRDLKKLVPKSTTLATVKNTLMLRAIADSEWEIAGSLAKDSNIWFFVKDEVKDSIAAYNEFLKSIKREAPVKGGVLEGVAYDVAGIAAVASLPSKKELIQQIAVGLNMVPTKLARSIKMIPTKVGRAIKLAVADEDAPAAE